MLTLVEKAGDAFIEEGVERLQQRIMSAKLKMMNRMGAIRVENPFSKLVQITTKKKLQIWFSYVAG